jgi:hypothetical protein
MIIGYGVHTAFFSFLSLKPIAELSWKFLVQHCRGPVSSLQGGLNIFAVSNTLQSNELRNILSENTCIALLLKIDALLSYIDRML